MSMKALWSQIQREAHGVVWVEPSMRDYLTKYILAHADFSTALTHLLASKLAGDVCAREIRQWGESAFANSSENVENAARDLVAAYDRDPACRHRFAPFLYYKGFHALQSHRVAHYLWAQGQIASALYLQSVVSERFAVDIHPASKIGGGVFLDHATGFVAGETSSIGDDVSLLHGVTLGGVGNRTGDRHPKIAQGVTIGAGAMVLGNITVGEDAIVGAGSVVLKPVEVGETVVGAPARPVQRTKHRQVTRENQPAIALA
jgi:serine O-acetyltransferase